MNSSETVFDIIQHLKQRGVDLSKTKVIVDEDTVSATFLIYNLSGKLIGYQYYNPNGSKSFQVYKKEFKNKVPDIESIKKTSKYYTWISDTQKGVSVYGLETYDRHSEFLFITEGVFDCIKIHNSGYPAIATLTNAGSSELKTWLKILPQKIIAICDNDDSGEKLKAAADYYYNSPNGYKDLGDAPQDIVEQFINNIVKEVSGRNKTKKLKQ